MRKTALLTLLAIFVTPAAIADVVRRSALPEPYAGTWVPEATSCENAEKDDGKDRSAIVLSPKTYVSPDASCTVDWVSETPGARGPIYSARLQCMKPADEAQTRSASNVVILPAGSDKISVGPEFAKLKAYKRCSDDEPTTGK